MGRPKDELMKATFIVATDAEKIEDDLFQALEDVTMYVPNQTGQKIVELLIVYAAP
ncbi:hypothetical protein DFH11DRAFT_1729586 [Phellopilus nigrolimitatus]|nr:hypothetical protein DFH11DRAFT_1729586 [Phellopilus nigrolimitatus]